MAATIMAPVFAQRAPSRFISFLISVVVLACVSLSSAPAHADVERSEGWNDATKILALSSAGLTLIMPRVFYSDPEVTVGWKARWHVSVLAPSMTLAAAALLNESVLKDAFESERPGCDDEKTPVAELIASGCGSEYGLFSTHTMLAFSSFGQGTGVFLADTLKWSGGRFNAGAFTGQVGVPLVLSIITAVGRTSGNWETGGQVWGSAGVGFGLGLGMGLIYGLLQRPECGYTGNLICW
jgi:hypothetical protein